jgi:hypothetical protein
MNGSRKYHGQKISRHCPFEGAQTRHLSLMFLPTPTSCFFLKLEMASNFAVKSKFLRSRLTAKHHRYPMHVVHGQYLRRQACFFTAVCRTGQTSCLCVLLRCWGQWYACLERDFLMTVHGCRQHKVTSTKLKIWHIPYWTPDA